MFNLGDKVKCKVTGYDGIVTGVSHWLNGCTTYGVLSQNLKDGQPQKTIWYDEPQLELVEKGVIKTGNHDGGPMPIPQRHLEPK